MQPISSRFDGRFHGAGLLGLLAPLLMVSACQTIAAPDSSFSSEQVTALERAGFERKGDSYYLGIPNRVLFDFDSSQLMPGKQEMIVEMAEALSDVGLRGANVEGYSDSTGAAAYNQALSYRRAEVVSNAMIAGGMDQSAMQLVGVGEANPVESNATEEGRSENRRVVIIITPAQAMKL